MCGAHQTSRCKEEPSAPDPTGTWRRVVCLVLPPNPSLPFGARKTSVSQVPKSNPQRSTGNRDSHIACPEAPKPKGSKPVGWCWAVVGCRGLSDVGQYPLGTCRLQTGCKDSRVSVQLLPGWVVPKPRPTWPSAPKPPKAPKPPWAYRVPTTSYPYLQPRLW